MILSRHRGWRSPHHVAVGFGVACAVASATGCGSHMPNTGIRFDSYTRIRTVETATEVSGLGGGLADKVAGQAAKILGDLLDSELEKLQSKYEGAYSYLYAHEGSIGAAAPQENRVQWEFVRGVRFPTTELAKKPSLFEPGFSEHVETYFRSHAPDLDAQRSEEIERAAGDAAKEEAAIEDVTYFRTGTTKEKTECQLIALRLTWDTVASADGKAFRVENPALEVYASEALLPDWERISGQILKAIPSDDLPSDRPDKKPNMSDVFGRIRRLADKAIRDELSLRLNVEITFTYPNDTGELVAAGSFQGTVKDIWPADTILVGDEHPKELRPAYKVVLEGFESMWLSNAGSNCNIKVRVTETSRVAEWIQKARKKLHEKLEKQSG